MIIEGEFTFDGPREAVWDLLLDPEILSRALPGSGGLEQTGEHRYEGRMNVGVGPVTAAEFTVSVTLSELEHPERYVMVIDGKGPIGFTKGRADVSLDDVEGGTAMTYRADLQIGGKIAGVGQRLLDSVSKAMTKQGLAALNKELQLRLTAANDTAEGDAATEGSGGILAAPTAAAHAAERAAGQSAPVTRTGPNMVVRALGAIAIGIALFLLYGLLR